VLSYDASNRRVTVSDGWVETRVLSLDQVWLNAPRRSGHGQRTRTRLYATLIGTGATLGAVIGSIITAWLLR
jgi:hypothetical protein